MPEICQVYIFSKRLSTYAKNKVLIDAKLLTDKKIKNFNVSDFNKFKQHLPSKIVNVISKGKKSIIEFENGERLVFSFGMVGRFVYPNEVNDGRHIRHNSKHFVFEFTLDGGRQFFLSDMWRFGGIVYLKNDEEYRKFSKTLGPDLLQDGVTQKEWIDTLRTKNKLFLVKVLMDQKIFSGIGNMYKAEILYDAKVSPFAKIQNLTDEDLIKLFKSTNKILRRSADELEKYGKHDTLVYEQKKDSHGHTVKTKITSDGRNTYYVPEVQTIGE